MWRAVDMSVDMGAAEGLPCGRRGRGVKCEDGVNMGAGAGLPCRWRGRGVNM
jgi:hypothetical protein